MLVNNSRWWLICPAMGRVRLQLRTGDKCRFYGSAPIFELYAQGDSTAPLRLQASVGYRKIWSVR